MKIAVDTNVLLRAVVRDNVEQADAAIKAMSRARMVAISLSSLCEFAWVLRSGYGFRSDDIGKAIRTLLAAENVVADRPAVEAGLAMLDAGSDFADGVIADDGRWLGAETFVSFDRKAVKLLTAQGVSARIL